jgi:RNA polymerase sigma factor (sigma-70 family)
MNVNKHPVGWEAIDWKKISATIVRRLKFVVATHGTFDCGVSVEDVWQETCTEFFDSSYGFDPNKGSLEAFLGSIARRKMIDHLRRDRRHTAGSFDDPEFPDLQSASSETENIEGIELRALAKAAAGGDKEAEAIIEATEQIDWSLKNVNQQLAKITGIPVKQIANIKRRYQRNCGDFYTRIRRTRRGS